MKKNILFITPYFAPSWGYGGPPKVLHILSKELTRRGFNINVATTDAFDEKRIGNLRETLNGVKIYRFRNISNYLAYQYKLFFVPDFLKKIKELINKADYILFSDLRPIMHWQIYKYVKHMNKSYGIFAFGQIPYDSGVKAIIKKFFDFLWVKDFVRNASLRFAQTPHEQKMYQKYFGIDSKDTQLLYLPVEGNPGIAYSPDLPKKYNLTENNFILLYVGRFNYLKGIDLLIDAIIPLININKNIKLVLIGRDDGIENQIRKIVPKELSLNIIFIGPKYQEQTQVWYKIASCFILTPRYFEETSLAALEALSFGTPVIVTKEADIPYLEKYQAGRVIPNEKKDIQEAILSLYNLWQTKKDKLRNNALNLISQKYKADIIALKLNKYLENII